MEIIGTHIVYTLYAEWFFAFGIQFDIGVLCGMQRRSGSTVCTCQFIRVVRNTQFIVFIFLQVRVRDMFFVALVAMVIHVGDNMNDIEEVFACHAVIYEAFAVTLGAINQAVDKSPDTFLNIVPLLYCWRIARYWDSYRTVFII